MAQHVLVVKGSGAGTSSSLRHTWGWRSRARPGRVQPGSHSTAAMHRVSIAPAQERKLSKTLSYQLQVVNIDYLRDFHAQEAN